MLRCDTTDQENVQDIAINENINTKIKKATEGWMKCDNTAQHTVEIFIRTKKAGAHREIVLGEIFYSFLSLSSFSLSDNNKMQML